MKRKLFQKARDRQLFRDAKRLNKDTFIKAYDLYLNDIYRFIYFKVADHDEAQDLSSQVFLKTWNYLQNKRIDDTSSLRALLYKVSRTTVVDYYRKSGREILSIDDTDNAIELVDDALDPEIRLDRGMDIEIVAEKLQKLKSEYKEIIILKYINELDNAEIAEIIGKSKGNVRILAHRALNALRNLYDEGQEL